MSDWPTRYENIDLTWLFHTRLHLRNRSIIFSRHVKASYSSQIKHGKNKSKFVKESFFNLDRSINIVGLTSSAMQSAAKVRKLQGFVCKSEWCSTPYWLIGQQTSIKPATCSRERNLSPSSLMCVTAIHGSLINVLLITETRTLCHI